MRVGVVVPAYNAETYLARTLDSIRAQTYPDWQAVVVDDGSKDATRRIATEYAERERRIRAVMQKNAGVCAARNRGTEALSDFDAFIYLDADDIWEPELLETLVGLLERMPDTVAAHGAARYIGADDKPFALGELEGWADEPRQAVAKFATLPDNRTTFTVFAWRNCLATAGLVLMRRAVIEKVGPWDVELSGAADTEYWLRLSSQGDFARTGRVLLNYRRTGASMSGNAKKMVADTKLALAKVVRSPLLTDVQKALFRASFRDHERTMRDRFGAEAMNALRRGDLRGTLINGLHCAKKAARYAIVNGPG